ncbi:MAG: DNA internalization-related competence protein ComEC/Rec2 [Oxalobacter formigenes]|nr:DNA internalization-related competence protein ComEC/Rec2 [Oxalobacter formigenes]
MRPGIAGLVLGMLLLQQQASLPGCAVLLFLATGSVIIPLFAFQLKVLAEHSLFRQVLFFLSGVLFGFAWSAAFAHFYLSEELPVFLENKDLVITGVVDNLPVKDERGVTFEFRVDQAEAIGGPVVIPSRILLSWHKGFRSGGDVFPEIHSGARWRLNVNLRRPHGYANPGGFDYEMALLKQRIRATGYVRHHDRLTIPNRELETFVSAPRHFVNRAREHLRDHIRQALPDARYAGVIIALVIGDQKSIPADDWAVFNRTGISHLAAISGTHITLISGMFAALLSFFWRRSFFTRFPLPLLLPAQKVAAAGSVFIAWVYVLLAGFGLPAQRTLYMLMVVAVALWTGRLTRVSYLLSAALGMVALLDPWAVLSPGFWLSFSAVGIILYILTGRQTFRGRDISLKTRWQSAVLAAARIQFAITLGLIPVTLLFFGSISLVSPIANALAIPLIGMVVTPLALLGSIVPSFLAQYVLGLAHSLVDMLSQVLVWLSAFSFASWRAPVPSIVFFGVAVAGTVWMLAPRGWPAKWLGIACWFPVFMAVPDHPAGGEARIIALDVGQGSAVLVETSHHRLLYDTGPVSSNGTDAGQRIIIPYLNMRGIQMLDALVVSHGDKDHAGGAVSLLTDSSLSIPLLYSSLPQNDPLVELSADYRLCLDGQKWEWDGVRFEMIGPTVAMYLSPETRSKSNALSCVLKVTAGNYSLLLPGDITAREEAGLLARRYETLKSDILLAPHHGSNTSSSLPFLMVADPVIAIFQSGYLNRYGHPDKTVYSRYGILGIHRFRTDEEGAVIVRFGSEIKAESWRSLHPRYWYGR